MGTAHTLKAKILKIRGTLKSAAGLEVSKKKLIAIMMLDGSTKRSATELIQAFIDSDEFIESVKDGEKILKYNEAFLDGQT